ncbi:hypothetical protein ACQUSR_29955 [Streptomyces sp. P1-3]|uniref:hypothetical protein n=1 Tax=Streptomyces sp. P1-3 TaxID=3421658 RepID=UPI003D36E864
MTDPMSLLAMTGASTIVAAMATSTWEVARDRTVALFRRGGDAEGGDTGGEGDAIRTELEAGAAQVRDAAAPEGARGAQTRRLRETLADLLHRDPEAAHELQALIDEVQGRLRDDRPVWHQSVTATGGGSAYGALGPGSSVHIHHHAPPHPSPPSHPTGAGDGAS